MQIQPGLSVVVVVILIIAVIWALFRIVQWNNNRGGLLSTVYEWEFALRYVNGKFDRVLPPGRYVKWSIRNRHDIFTVRRTEQIEILQPVDVRSKDGLIFRMSAVIAYRIVDAREAYEGGHIEKLRLAASQALVKLAAGHELQPLLSDRAASDASLTSLLEAKICGCEIASANVQAVTLPPELRRLFVEIERAKLEGVAALERARGENAALRSLANAAGILMGNPELMNLRILQTMSAPSGRNQLTLVLGKNGLVSESAGGG
jgi:regulator of protease activity HflC (stomatin/prohibitin superfamily)